MSTEASDRAGVPARVLVHLRAPDGDASRVEEAYHSISRALEGTAGLLRNELLQDIHQPEFFAVLSEWESLEAFRAWEGGASHRSTTAPLRPYQDHSLSRPFGIYAVTARY